MALKLVLEEQAETLLSPALAISVKPADGANFQETFFSISDPDTVQVRAMNIILITFFFSIFQFITFLLDIR